MPQAVDAVPPAGLRRRGVLRAALALGLAGPLGWRPGAAAATTAPLMRLYGPAPSAIRRVFVAGSPAAVLLTCLAPDLLVGWPMTLSPQARALLPAVARNKPTLGRLAGRGSTVNLGALLAQQPDLILDAGTVDATYASTAQRLAAQTGLPYALVDGRLADTPAQLREVGRLLGVNTRAQRLAAHAEEVLGGPALAGRAAAHHPGVYLARSADGLETATVGAINGEIIEAAGGRNVAATGRAGVVRVSMEQVLGWAPEWVLTQDLNFFRHAQQDPVWRTLSAIQAGRLLLAPSLPFGWINGPPGVNRLLGVAWLAERLRGRVGAQDEALAVAVRFHTLFYGVTPEPETVRSWLDGRA